MINQRDNVDPFKQIKLIRAAEVAKLFQISNATLWRWVADPNRDFPQSIKLGPNTRAFFHEDIHHYLQQMRSGK
jgi:predicted DNA-binding transcriptional regulator AlpA